MNFKLKKNNGITLIALVVAIIVILILAGISISSLTGQNGIIRRAIVAKEEMNKSNMEEKLKMILFNDKIDNYTSQTDENSIEEELKKMGTNVLVVKWQNYIIFDLDTNEEYRIMDNGKIENIGTTNLGQKLKNTKTADPEQLEWDSSSTNIIGLDDEGNTVNMLRWEYVLIDSESIGKVGTYALNDINALDATGSSGRTSGYKESYVLNDKTISNYNEDGTIKGKIPAYISIDGGENFISVTNMVHTFYVCDKLIKAPEIPNTIVTMSLCFFRANNLTNAPSKIPGNVKDASYSFRETSIHEVPVLEDGIQNIKNMFESCTIINKAPTIPQTVTNMASTFSNCPSLEKMPEIPDNVINLQETFKACTSLNEISSIGKNVENMDATFRECVNLTEAPNIPSRVSNMEKTFFGCTSLQKMPTVLPETVNNMMETFADCTKLHGTITINANITGRIVHNYNNKDYYDYTRAFNNTGLDGSGITILKSSKTPKDMLNLLINNNSKISIEE